MSAPVFILLRLSVKVEMRCCRPMVQAKKSCSVSATRSRGSAVASVNTSENDRSTSFFTSSTVSVNEDVFWPYWKVKLI